MNDTSGSEYVTSEDGVYRVDQIAYEIWTWKAQRSNKETARQLGELGFEGITTKQVAAWAMSYKWSVLADNDIKNLAPSIHNETLGGLIIAGLKGQRVLDKLLEEWMEKRIEPNAQVVKMLDMTFKYAGMSPMGTRDPTERVRSKGGAASSIVERYLSPEEIAKYIGADSVMFLPIEELERCLTDAENYCYACFNGKYPLPVRIPPLTEPSAPDQVRPTGTDNGSSN